MKNMSSFDFTNYAKKCHNDANCVYDGRPYGFHLDMVESGILTYKKVFNNYDYFLLACNGAIGHDLIEDAGLTFNNIEAVTNKRTAQVILSVTDVPEENRLMRHLMTMSKTVKDPIGIIVKMADLRANASYSKATGSSMYKKYKEEYKYRRPIFKGGLKWYTDMFNQEVLANFWLELDEIHEWNE